MKEFTNFRFLLLIAAIMGLQYACSFSGDDEFVNNDNTIDNVPEMLGAREPIFDIADTSPPPHGTVVRFPAIDILTNAEISVERVVQLNVPLSGIDMSVFELSDGRTIKNTYWPEGDAEPAFSVYGVYLSATALSDGINPFYNEEFLRRQPLLVSTESETGYGYGCVTADVQAFADIGFPSPSINTSVELVSAGTVQSGWVLCAGPENAVNQLVVSWANNPDHPDFASPLWRPLRILGQGDGVLLPLFYTYNCNNNVIFQEHDGVSACSFDMGESYYLEDGGVLEDYVGPAKFHLSSIQTSMYGNRGIGVKVYSTVNIPDEELMSACSTIPVPEALSDVCFGKFEAFEEFLNFDDNERIFSGNFYVFSLRFYTHGLNDPPGIWKEHELTTMGEVSYFTLGGGDVHEAYITEPMDAFWVELVARTKDNQYLTIALWQLPVPQYLVHAIDTSLVCSQTECALSAQEAEENYPDSNLVPRAPVPVIQPNTQAAGVTFSKYIEHPEIYQLVAGRKTFWKTPAFNDSLSLSVDCVPIDGLSYLVLSAPNPQSSCRSLHGIPIVFPNVKQASGNWDSTQWSVLTGKIDAGVLYIYKDMAERVIVRPAFSNRDYWHSVVPSDADMEGAFIVLEQTGPIYSFVGE